MPGRNRWCLASLSSAATLYGRRCAAACCIADALFMHSWSELDSPRHNLDNIRCMYRGGDNRQAGTCYTCKKLLCVVEEIGKCLRMSDFVEGMRALCWCFVNNQSGVRSLCIERQDSYW